jgi:hypothetical protein
MNIRHMAIAMVAALPMVALAQKPNKPLSPLKTPTAYIFGNSVSFNPQSNLVRGMLIVSDARMFVMTSVRECDDGAGTLFTDDGLYRENVVREGGTKADALFESLCGFAIAKRQAYAREVAAARRQAADAATEKRANDFLMREAERFARGE